jgi:hypothetical protein
MIWQDIVISITSFMFAISLFIQVYHGFKQKKGYIMLKTSGLTAIGLYAMAVCFFTLGLFFSSLTSLISGILWSVLFVQRKIYAKV